MLIIPNLSITARDFLFDTDVKEYTSDNASLSNAIPRDALAASLA